MLGAQRISITSNFTISIEVSIVPFIRRKTENEKQIFVRRFLATMLSKISKLLKGISESFAINQKQ